MPGDGYDSDRAGFDSNERGRIFENGAYQHFRDRENGYVQQSRTYGSGKDRIKFDKVRDDRGRISSIEDKSGRIGGKKDEKQLEVVLVLLDKGVIEQHTLRSVEGEPISPRAQELIQKLLLKHGEKGKFVHQLIPRTTEAREVWSKGLQLEPQQQLELPGVGEKARTQQARQREDREKTRGMEKNLRKGPELTKLKEQLAKDVAAQNKHIEDSRKQGKELDADKLAKAHKDLTEKLDKIRDKEQVQRLDMINSLSLSKDDARIMEVNLALRQEEQRRDVVLGLNTIAHTVRDEDRQRAERDAVAKQQERERQARELADKQRTAALEKAHRDGIPPEILKFLALGQAEAPNVAVERGPHGTPEVTRGGRESMERSRELRRER